MFNREGIHQRHMIVFIKDEEVFGQVIHLGAHVSTIRYQKDGFEYELLMENDEFIFMED